MAEATNPLMLLRKLTHIDCDVLVTDFSMPCRHAPDGLALLNALRNRFPHVRIVVLTMLENPGLLVSMRKAGALCLLNKRDGCRSCPMPSWQRFRAASTSVHR